MNTESILVEYIQNEVAKGRKAVIKADDDLLGEGILDSLGILQLVSFIEENFNYQVPDEDVVLENFQSVSALAGYLNSKIKA